jgi:hypothetical protein
MYLVFGVSILLTLSSCLTILQELVTQENIITDSRIEGLWIDPDSKSILVQKMLNSKFKPKADELERHDYTYEDSLFFTKIYVISFREMNLDYTWFAGIVKIKDQYYLSLRPQDCLSSNGRETYRLRGNDYLTTGSIAKLEWKNNNSLLLHFFNGDHIKEIVLNGMARIRHEYDPLFDTFVITASSREIEQFLEKYGNNESLFRGGSTIILSRKI